MSEHPGEVDVTDLRQQIEASENPWEQLKLIQRLAEAEDRMEFFSPWLKLVAQRPSEAERESLLAGIKDVWEGIRIATARDQVKTTMETMLGAARASLGFANDDILVETVYRPDTDKPLGYLVHEIRGEKEPAEVESVTVGKVTFKPPSSLLPLLQKDVIALPGNVEGYDSSEALFAEVEACITSYVQLADTDSVKLCTAYVFLTWVFDRFSSIPYLRAIGDWGTGKTRLIEVVGSFCYRPMKLGGAASPAALFRIIDKVGGTLVLDERDFGTGEMEDTIIKVLTSGYKQGFPVLRAEKSDDGNFDVRSYTVYGPKVISSRRTFRDSALESRCLTLTMSAGTAMGTDQPFQLTDEFAAEATRLRNKLLWWRFQTWPSVQINPRERLDGLEPRINEVALPLLAVAPATIRRRLLALFKNYSDDLAATRQASWEGLIVTALAQEFKNPSVKAVYAKTLADRIQSSDEGIAIPYRRIAEILRVTFRFITTKTGGRVLVHRDDRRLERLLARYGVGGHRIVEEPIPQAPALASLNGAGPATPVSR